MDVSIHFNDQCRLMTVKVNDEPFNDLLPPEMDSQLIRTQFLPENLFGESDITAKFAGAIEVLLYFPNAMTVFLYHYK